MDASRNWWGAENGPSGVGPGSGDDLYISGSTFVFWRPFCTVEDCSELSTADVELPGEGLTDFFNTGSFVASGSFVGESFDVDSITL